MGFVHDTKMAQWIDPALIGRTAGTWTPTVSGNKTFLRRTAADANFTLLIPVAIPSNSGVEKGSLLRSIDVFYNITSAALDDIATVELEKQSLSSVGAHTGAAVTTTIDAAHDTGAERKATGEHKMTVSLSTAEYIDDDEFFVLQIVCDGSAAGVFDLVGARVNYTDRR